MTKIESVVLARPTSLILHLFWLAIKLILEMSSSPLVHHLDPTACVSVTRPSHLSTLQ
jgi:hypothetical protein